MKSLVVAAVVTALLACGACGTGDAGEAGDDSASADTTETLQAYGSDLDRVGADCAARHDTECGAFSEVARKLSEYLKSAPDEDPRFHLSTLTPHGFARTYCAQKHYDQRWKSYLCGSLVSKAAKFHIERLINGAREVKVR